MGTLPNLGAWLAETWGWGPESPGLSWLAGFSNLVVGSNPAYTVVDFLQIYPAFGGTTISVTATKTDGSATLTNVAQYQLLNPGQLITGPGVVAGSIVLSIGPSSNVVISNPVSGSGTTTLTGYPAMLLPLPALSAYIALASASLTYARWQAAWTLAMALFIAHYATLWLQSDGDGYSTPGQKAAAGLQAGILASESAGQLSHSFHVPGGLEDWGSWATTSYGQQLATMARVMGSGPVMLY